MGSLEENKFEQVSSDGQQMSLAGGLAGSPCLGGGWGEGAGGPHVPSLGERELYSEVQCIMDNSHVWPPVDMAANITFSQLRWRAVKMPYFLNFKLVSEFIMAMKAHGPVILGDQTLAASPQKSLDLC